jgi:hypothetical protein
VVVYFQVMPECFFLTVDTKEKFFQECTTDDGTSKVNDLMENLDEFHIEMIGNLKLYRTNELLSAYSNETHFVSMMKVTFYISIVINALVLLGYSYRKDEATNESRFTAGKPFQIAIDVLTYLLILIAAFFLFIWTFAKYRFSLQMAENYYKSTKDFEKSSWLVRNFKIFIFRGFLTQPIPMMFSLQILFCFLALGGSVVSHSFHLHLLFFLSQTSRYIVTAITANYDQVLVTFMVGLFLTISFAIINAIEYRFGWDPLTAGDMDMCETMIGCFGYALDFGLRNGGGLADSHDTVGFERRYGGLNFWMKILFNLGYFILISKFVLDIIFGIIIDSFTEMRDNHQKRSKCLGLL